MTAFDGSYPPSAANLLIRSPWTARRMELLRWFQKNAVALAPSYEGAVRLLMNESFPGRIHFIGHAVRDIADRLPFVLNPQNDPHRVQYEEHLDTIQKQWPAIDKPTSSKKQLGADEVVSIPLLLARQIDKLVNEHRTRRSRPSNAQLLIEYLTRMHSSSGGANLRIVEQFKDIRKWFMGLTHLRVTEAPDVGQSELLAKFEAFEDTLHSFVGNFFTGTGDLDAILKQANE